MKGLEISKAYYKEFGEPMLKEKFSEIIPYIATGVFGSGSECFGFDDDVSRDHDFDPGFMVLLPGEDLVDRKQEFALERAYAALPKEFMGVKRPAMSPVGGNRRGVIRTAEYFSEKVGALVGALGIGDVVAGHATAEASSSDTAAAGMTDVATNSALWLSTPSYALAEAVNGEVFFDGLGEVTRIREALKSYPDDVRKKKLAGHLLLMAQAGQYNYTRCIQHGENAAAQLAAIEFARNTMSAIFLLNETYEPFYKWSFRAMRNLPKLSLTAELLEYLITTDNEGPSMAAGSGQSAEESGEGSLAQDKYDVVEGIAADVIDELIAQGLTKANCGDLEKHAYSVNDGIADSELRNRHILAGI
ncbi:MAG: DUF4037 domain-containing protein [Firmicutes bacterium]|nr:DUF4037 domain-containing protein [Bacillota bacterium]